MSDLIFIDIFINYLKSWIKMSKKKSNAVKSCSSSQNTALKQIPENTTQNKTILSLNPPKSKLPAFSDG